MTHTDTTTTTARKDQRIKGNFTAVQRRAIEEFKEADMRPSLENAMVALAMLGYEYWKTKQRPKGQSLVPMLEQAGEQEEGVA